MISNFFIVLRGLSPGLSPRRAEPSS